MTTHVIAVAAGGAAGAVLRYLVTLAVTRGPFATLPWATFAVNVVGCFLIGLLATLFAGPWLERETLRVAVLVGILGGLTTFSTFAFEAISLIGHGRIGMAVAYVAVSNAAGLAAVWLGFRLAAR